MGQPPRSRNKLEMRQIAREKKETTFSTLENVTRRVAAWRGRRIEYRKRDAEEGREGGSARVAYEMQKGKSEER